MSRLKSYLPVTAILLKRSLVVIAWIACGTSLAVGDTMSTLTGLGNTNQDVPTDHGSNAEATLNWDTSWDQYSDWNGRGDVYQVDQPVARLAISPVAANIKVTIVQFELDEWSGGGDTSVIFAATGNGGLVGGDWTSFNSVNDPNDQGGRNVIALNASAFGGTLTLNITHTGGEVSYLALDNLVYSTTVIHDPTKLQGDTDDDEDVDVGDLNRVRNNFGLSGEFGLPGDTYPFDGVVDIGDLNAVRNNFGATQATLASVPEPNGWALALIALFGVVLRGVARRRLRRIASLGVPIALLILFGVAAPAPPAFAIVAGLSPDSPANRVDPNTMTSPFAGVGSLLIPDAPFLSCTAFPISRRHILTAAHCVEPFPQGNSFYLNFGPRLVHTFAITDTTIHPSYGSNDHDDVAVLKLDATIPEGFPVYPLYDAPLEAGTALTLVGYGMSGDPNGLTVDRSLTVKRVGANAADLIRNNDDGSPDVPEMFYFDFDGPEDLFGNGIIGGPTLGNEVETTPGYGDSGGPALLLDGGIWKAVGVISSLPVASLLDPSLPDFPHPGFRSVAGGAILAAHADWIRSVTGPQLAAGDTDGDGDVDFNDLNAVRNGFGTAGSSDGTLDGDAFPWDGRVDIGDLNAVRNNFDAAQPVTASVPEPSGWAIALLGLAAVTCWRRRIFCRWSSAALVMIAVQSGANSVHAQGQPFRLEEATVQEISAALGAGTMTSEELVRRYLVRIASYDQAGPSLNSIITINPRALATARALDAQRRAGGATGPLFGVPVLLKDNFDTFDMPTTAGSLSLANSIPPDDAFVTQRLRDAGAIILGKTNLHEFAAGATTLSSLGGQTRNAYDTTRIPGGSSGGTGASIAANFAAAGLGTETQTSIRAPAVFNGLVGLRPTPGLVSRDGIIPLYHSLDTAGPMTRTVTDTAIVLDAIAGFDPADPDTQASVGNLPFSYTQSLTVNALDGAHLGVVRQFNQLPGAQPDVIALANAAIAEVVSKGAQLVDPLDVGPQGNLSLVNSLTFEYDMNRYLESLEPNAPYHNVQEIVASGLYLPELRDGLFSLLRGDVPPEQDPPFIQFLQERTDARASMIDIMDSHHVDALMHVTMDNVAPPIGDINLNFVGMSYASYLGLPSITVPAGFTTAGLPVGITFTGRPFSEPLLIGLAYSYEQATHHRQPPATAPPLADPDTAVLTLKAFHTVVDDGSSGGFDGRGDSVLQYIATRRPPAQMAVGESHAAAGNQESRAVLKFALPKLPELLQDLEQAVLRVYLQAIEGNPDLPVSLLHSLTDNSLSPQASDYEAASYIDTELLAFGATDLVGRYYDLDVTHLVLSDYAADSMNPVSAFRLQADDGLLGGDQNNRYLLNRAGSRDNPPELLLMFVPEPSGVAIGSIAMLGVILCSFARRRAR